MINLSKRPFYQFANGSNQFVTSFVTIEMKTIFFFSWNQISCTGWSVWKKSERNGCSSETVHIRPNVFEKLWFSLITKNVSTFFSCLHDFSIIQILREINCGACRSFKTAIFSISGALNFVDLVNLSLQKVQNFTTIKFQSIQMC